MSPQPLQERILDVVRKYQPLRASQLRLWLPDVDHIALDCGMGGLIRANKVSLCGGYYDLVKAERSSAKAPAVAAPETPAAAAPKARPTTPPAPPTAAEEAAASLTGEPVLYPCERCQVPQDDSDYQHSKHGKRFKVCRQCNIELREEKRVPGPVTVVEPVPRFIETKNPPAAEGATRPAAPPHASPPQPPGSVTEPPATSSGQPEALSPVPRGDGVLVALKQKAANLEAVIAATTAELAEINQAVATIERHLPEVRV